MVAFAMVSRHIVSPQSSLFVLVGIMLAGSPRSLVAAPTAPPKIAVAPEPPELARGPRKRGSGAMVKIPGGTFNMGDNVVMTSLPIHSVTVASFELDETEVTVDAYKACVDDKRCSTSGVTFTPECNWGGKLTGQHPMNCIDWSQAAAFCKWAGKRLPTEEEWEYAARRGAEGRTYPWGNAEPNKQLCWRRSRDEGTCPVGMYASKADPWGLKDMAGNVREWTANGWSDDYSKTRVSDSRVLRGGGWDNTIPTYIRVGYRNWSFMYDSVFSVGVRCAADSMLP